MDKGRDMAIKIISDNQIDHELAQMKVFAESLKKNQSVFSHTYKIMTVKDRAAFLRQIKTDQTKLEVFIQKAKKTPSVNSGTKFAIENLIQTFQSLMSLWRKTERLLGAQAE